MPVFMKENRKVLFIHIPKTGGTSIEKIFTDGGWSMSFFDGGGRGSINGVLKCSPQHFHADILTSLFELSSFDAVFMLVRDPLSRLVSEFNWRRQHALIAGNCELNEWLKQAILSYEHDPFIFDNHIRPQCQFELPGADIFKLESGISEVALWLSEKLEVEFSGDGVWEMRSTEGGPAVVDDLSDYTVGMLKEFYSADYGKYYG